MPTTSQSSSEPEKSPASSPPSYPFTDREWWLLPLALRQRWWDETNYSRLPPSAELVAEIRRVLSPTGRAPTGPNMQNIPVRTEEVAKLKEAFSGGAKVP